MDNDIKIEMRKESAIDPSGNIILTLRSVGANITEGKKTAWMTWEVPSDKELRIAYPMPGCGPKPENTVDFSTLSDIVLSIIDELHLGIKKSEVPLDQEKSAW